MNRFSALATIFKTIIGKTPNLPTIVNPVPGSKLFEVGSGIIRLKDSHTLSTKYVISFSNIDPSCPIQIFDVNFQTFKDTDGVRDIYAYRKYGSVTTSSDREKVILCGKESSNAYPSNIKLELVPLEGGIASARCNIFIQGHFDQSFKLSDSLIILNQ